MRAGPAGGRGRPPRALQDHARFLELFIEHAPVALAMFDRELRYLQASRRWRTDYGIGDRPLEGHSHYEIFPEIPERWKSVHRRALAGEVVRCEEDRFERADGAVQWLRWEVRPWTDAGGAIGGIVVFTEDITARKTAESALRESEQRLRLALEASHVGIFDWDLVTGRITWSRGHEELWGFAPGEFDGSYVSFASRVHPEDLPGLDAEVARCIARREPFMREFRVVWPDGGVFWIAGRGEFEFDGARAIRMRGTVTETTARRAAEEEVRRLNEELRRDAQRLEQRVRERTAQLVAALERAEAADRVKSAFLATMSHELRTPLNSIIGFTGILLEGLAGPLAPEQAKQLRIVEESARHLHALINDVLDLTRIEAGQLALFEEPVDLRQVVETAVSSIRPLAERKGLRLDVTISPDVAATTSDRRRVEQVLLNLLSNAVKFTEQGTVAVVARVGPAGNPPVPHLCLEVNDSGIGIAADDLQRIFEPFRQLDSGLARQQEGTGLGLAICQRLAGLLGGAVQVRSRPGEGSTFTFRLPLRSAPDS